MILSCYLPVMLIHANRIAVLRTPLGDAPAKDDKGPNLPQLNYTTALKSMMAILSPILASAVGSFGQGVLFP